MKRRLLALSLCAALLLPPSPARGAEAPKDWAANALTRLQGTGKLTNADFTRTRIQDADFSGAVMDGTVIERKLLDRLSLSPEQLQAVKLVDE